MNKRNALEALVLILGGHAGSMAASIRYGFLAVSFEKREIPGKVFGFIEGTIFFGYLAGFLLGKYSQKFTEWISPKWMVVSSVIVLAMTCAMSGLADYVSDNTPFVIISIASRVLFGFVEFPKNVATLDILKSRYPDKFDFVNGVMQMGFYSGHGAGEYIGVLLYTKFGYKVPFLYTFSLMVLVLLLSIVILSPIPSISISDPNDETYEAEFSEEEKMLITKTSSGLTPYIWIPMVACMLINCIYAYLQISCTPYLLQTFKIPLSVGGTVLMLLSIGIAIGSLLSGALTQRKLCNAYTQMAIGASAVGLGLLLLFPSPSVPFLYNNVPYLAYPAVLLCGIGDPIITVPTLRAITDLQIMIRGKCTGKNSINLFSVWMMASWGAMYSGTIVAGMMMEYLSFLHGSYVLVASCCASVLICVVVNLVTERRKGKEEKLKESGLRYM